MTYPVYIGDRAAGTMTVTAAGQDTVFELRCPDPEPGLWRAWVQGEEGRLDLGILEGGRLRRRFSRRLTASLGGARGAGGRRGAAGVIKYICSMWISFICRIIMNTNKHISSN